MINMSEDQWLNEVEYYRDDIWEKNDELGIDISLVV